MKELRRQAYDLIAQDRIEQCIDLLERALQDVPTTPYHAIIGRDLLAMTTEASQYLQTFYLDACSDMPVAAIYFEMNGFYINPNHWYANTFAYDTWENSTALNWLCGWKFIETDHLIITGFEDLQIAYRDFARGAKTPPEIQTAADFTDYLIVLRLQQLMQAAHQHAITQNPALKHIPVLSTAHEFNFIHVSHYQH